MSQEMDFVLELIRQAPDDHDEPIEVRRANMDALAASAPTVEGVATEPATVGGIAGLWVRAPGAAADGALLYLHGGGYASGSSASHAPLAGHLSAATGLPALVIDYRRAPEHPFPAAVDDAVAAYRALVGSGLTPGRIAVAGDSAGGGLTLATLLALRDAGDELPAAGACLSPWTDLTGTAPSIDANADRDVMLTAGHLKQYADWYLDGEDPEHPLASPRFADLQGLPPVLVHVAEDEILLDDSREVAAAIEATGGTVEYRSWPGVFHVWHAVVPLAPEAVEAVEALGAFVRRHLA